MECVWNAPHTSGFHDAWKHYPGPFSLPADHDYWELSGKTFGVTTGTGAYEIRGAGTQSQCCLDLSEVISRHQGEATDATFYSFLNDFSKLFDHLK